MLRHLYQPVLLKTNLLGHYKNHRGTILILTQREINPIIERCGYFLKRPIFIGRPIRLTMNKNRYRVSDGVALHNQPCYLFGGVAEFFPAYGKLFATFIAHGFRSLSDVAIAG
jgi:hypothetical protein